MAGSEWLQRRLPFVFLSLLVNTFFWTINVFSTVACLLMQASSAAAKSSDALKAVQSSASASYASVSKSVNGAWSSLMSYIPSKYVVRCW
jgi:hypothetical protein